jgi:hypothetical protein
MTFPDTVEEFMEQYKITDTDHVYSNGIEFVPIFRMKQWFEHLQSAQPEPKWIPCSESERLPEEEYVLISKKPTKLSGSKFCVTVAIRTADPRSGKIYWKDMGFGVISDDNVLAWMPRPEPYREEGEQQC